MSYDGMYSDLSTRGTSNQILTLVLEARDQVILAEDNVEVLEAQAVSSAASAAGAASSASSSAASALASATTATTAQSASAISAAAAAQSAIDAETNSEAALIVANAAQADADAAVVTANGIAGTANTALSNSTTAVTTANSAVTIANSAFNAANNANVNAQEALDVANGIAATANTALSNSEDAIDTADAAAAAVATKQDGDPMLTALAGLTTVADRGLYFTGADAPAQYTLTSYARTLLDDADAATARTTLGVGPLTKALISGLYLSWVSATSISISTGSCYIESLGQVLESNSVITVSSIATTNGLMYHAYLYSDSGTPAVEISTTGPSSTPFSGTARSKTSDTSRRYLGSFIATATDTIAKFHHFEGGMYYGVHIAGSPFQIVNSNASVSTVVDASSVVPLTGTHVSINMTNSDASISVRISNPDFITPVSSSAFTASMQGNSTCPMDLSISAARTFIFRFDSAPSGVFIGRVYGYLFRR